MEIYTRKPWLQLQVDQLERILGSDELRILQREHYGLTSTVAHKLLLAFNLDSRVSMTVTR